MVTDVDYLKMFRELENAFRNHYKGMGWEWITDREIREEAFEQLIRGRLPPKRRASVYRQLKDVVWPQAVQAA